MVIAGAGSGKTTTIVGRVKYLINDLKISKDEILLISFTNASVKSLKEKLYDEIGENIDVYTFHKLSLNILENAKYKMCMPDLLEYLVLEYLGVIIKTNIDDMYTILRYFNPFTLKINVLKKYELIPAKDIDMLSKLIVKFIKLMKTNGYHIDKFRDFFKGKIRTKRFYLIKIILRIYELYILELESSGEIDFDDMIIKAKDEVEKNGIEKNYKYIIIDEYQDSSLIRFNLVKAILEKNNASLFVVGDDFQSIYKFAGCDLNVMLDFSKHFSEAKMYSINNTYRNSQELIDIAGDFIMKNRRQIKKKLVSQKHLENPIKIVRYKNYRDDFKKLIEKISVKNSILVLGRNNKDIYKILDKDYNVDGDFNIEYKPTGIRIKYMTIHRSKGLEADVVILINLIDTLMGLPSKLVDDKILKFVSPKIDNFPYSEERRLFYVALTRTKSYVYLYTPIVNESIFIKEIRKIIEKRGKYELRESNRIIK